ncbi:hypothetical protein WMY93_009893 [Mugilogobius chulae]|uniref:C2H2-type domain-containing protein n=1 Tax=Mugilogobius chulae TaxID=88201 RepID=A0AAW0PG69_9GOBI
MPKKFHLNVREILLRKLQGPLKNSGLDRHQLNPHPHHWPQAQHHLKHGRDLPLRCHYDKVCLKQAEGTGQYLCDADLERARESVQFLNLSDTQSSTQDQTATITSSKMDESSELTFSSLTSEEMADLGVTMLPTVTAAQPSLPPPSYCIIFDNLDFSIRTHHQSLAHGNTSLHWIHHVAVEDRVPIYNLNRDKPVQSIVDYNIGKSLPGPNIQAHMRREFIVLGSRILTQYVHAFKPLSPVVVHHIPHQYSTEMAEASVHSPHGLSSILVGGDRLTEGNSRNIQWAFADGDTKEDRLEGLTFKFEDWHAIRNLFEEFVKKDTYALFLTATLQHFGMKDLADTPEGFIPDSVLNGSPEMQRSWLHEAVAKIVDIFVTFDDIADIATGVEEAAKSQPTKANEYPCRNPGCAIIYKYQKSRENHERDVHGLASASVAITDRHNTQTVDHKKQHTEARLSFGLLLMDMQDAVKEGDGERLLRLYSVAFLLYKTYGHHQYAYSTFLLTVQVNATLSPSLAHSIKWNRFWNGQGGQGRNIPLDLHLEHLNNFLKSFLKRSGPNITEQAANRVSKALGVLKVMMEITDRELGVTKSGIHQSPSLTDDVACLVHILTEAKVFQNIPGREFTAFPKFERDLFAKTTHTKLWGWMKAKLKEWRSVPI